MDSIKKIPNWIRWFFAIPVAFLIAYLSILLTNISISILLGHPLDRSGIVYLLLESPIRIYIFLVCIYYFSPQNKRITLIITSIIIAAILAYSLYATLYNFIGAYAWMPTWKIYTVYGSSFLSIVLVNYYIYRAGDKIEY